MDNKKFFDAVRQHPFHGSLSQSQVEGLSALLAAGSVLIMPQLAYLLATAYHETAATMQPIAEYGHGAGHDYGIPDQTGKAPYGRGYVQLTSRTNYIKADAELGLGGRLAANYDLALDPAIAAKIIVRGMSEGWFTGKKLNDYVAVDLHDFYDARRIVNGLDKAQLIADYADYFLAALKGAALVSDVAPVPPQAIPEPSPPPTAKPPPAGILARVWASIKWFFVGKF